MTRTLQALIDKTTLTYTLERGGFVLESGELLLEVDRNKVLVFKDARLLHHQPMTLADVEVFLSRMERGVT